MQLQEFKHSILPYKNKLFRFALQFVQNPAEAQDVVQEVFIKMWDARETLHQIENKEAWCMRLTRNLALDKLRSKHQKVQSLMPSIPLVEPQADPYRQTELNDSVANVKRLIAALPEKQRLVIHLRDVEQMQYKEIAEQLDISMEQVKVNLFRARKTIRKQFKHTDSYGI